MVVLRSFSFTFGIRIEMFGDTGVCCGVALTA